MKKSDKLYYLGAGLLVLAGLLFIGAFIYFFLGFDINPDGVGFTL